MSRQVSQQQQQQQLLLLVVDNKLNLSHSLQDHSHHYQHYLEIVIAIITRPSRLLQLWRSINIIEITHGLLIIIIIL